MGGTTEERGETEKQSEDAVVWRGDSVFEKSERGTNETEVEDEGDRGMLTKLFRSDPSALATSGETVEDGE